jgi:2-polyprenyl-6-methoxyphenol hydroxylase-like FAD-dependent oxidoreductase
VRVRLSDGSERRAALLVGADGLRSRVRELVFGPVPLRYAGSTCWRLVAPRPPGLRRMQEMWHRGLRFGVLPIGGGRVYAFATAHAPEGTADPVEGRLERLRRRFAAFAPPVAAVLAGVDDPAAILHDDLRELVHRPWHRGRVVLLGDAAHAMTPNMGQGAAMALEDAAVLAELVAGAADPADALPAWSARRAPRVTWVQHQSRRIGRVAEARGRLACALRDAVARRVPDHATLHAVKRMAAQPI